MVVQEQPFRVNLQAKEFAPVVERKSLPNQSDLDQSRVEKLKEFLDSQASLPDGAEILNKIPLSYVLGFAAECCRDQTCSRFIQSKLTSSNDLPENDPLTIDKELFYQEIDYYMKHIDKNSLFKDVFGNYVIQKMLESGNRLQVNRIYETVKSNVLEYSKDSYGCRVVQRIFDDLILTEF